MSTVFLASNSTLLPCASLLHLTCAFLVACNSAARISGQEAAELAQAEPEHVQRVNLLNGLHQRVYVIDVDRQIDGLFNWYLTNRLDRAKSQGADLVVIRLTTPGGDLEHSLNLARLLLDCDWAKIVVWIPREAISGGAIVSLGADAVIMQKSAMIGDAGPVMLGPGGEFVHAQEKIVSYTATAVRELAKASGRPEAIAEAMVDRTLKVFLATNKKTGQITYLTQQQTQDPGWSDEYDIGQAIAEAGENRFLTVGAERALELQLCDAVLTDESDLLERLTSQPVITTQLDWKDRLVYTLNRPWLTALLLLVGIVGLYLEISAPGLSLPGLVAVLCFSLFFWSHSLGGTAIWLEVLFFALGVGCLLIEFLVLPGFGVFGLSGSGLILIALIMATQDFLVPETPAQWRQLEVNSLSVFAAFIVLGAVIAVQIFFLDSIPGLRRFQLKPAEPTAAVGLDLSQPSGQLCLGQQGTCQSDLRPSGKAIFGDLLVDVLSEGDYVERGTQVRVVRIEGNIVTVRRND